MKVSTIALSVLGLAAPATAFTSYADAMSGGVKPPKPASYGIGGGGAKPQAYQAPVAPPPVVAANSADVHSQAPPASTSFPGGSAAPVKAGGYGPSKGPYKVAAPVVGSYLDAVSGGGGGGGGGTPVASADPHLAVRG